MTRLVIVLWFACGFLAWGVQLREDRFEFRDYVTDDCRHDQSFAIAWGEFGGPVSLGMALVNSGFAEHGLQWRCPSSEGK